MTSEHGSSRKNIVVLGGSYGGISIAHCLLKHVLPALPRKQNYKVMMISAASEAMCRQACPRALVSDDFFPQDKLFVSIPKQFEQYPTDQFEFIHGSATTVDHERRTVIIAPRTSDQTQTLVFHTLVIATGASTPSPLFGFNVSDEKALHRSWSEFRNGLDTAKSIVIAGGGPAGVETAGELGEHLNGRAGFFNSKLSRPKVSITVVTSAANILPATLNRKDGRRLPGQSRRRCHQKQKGCQRDPKQSRSAYRQDCVQNHSDSQRWYISRRGSLHSRYRVQPEYQVPL
jgi:NADH dehydrogenase FAD-containing subunit